MRKLNYLLGLSALIVLLFAGGCKDDDPGTTPQEDQLKKMAATWKVASGANAVTFDGDNSVKDDFSDMVLIMTEAKTYTTTGSDADRSEVWPVSGHFDFVGSSISDIVRDGRVNTSVEFNSDGSEMTMSFTLTEDNTGGRLDGFLGPWVFVFTK